MIFISFNKRKLFSLNVSNAFRALVKVFALVITMAMLSACATRDPDIALDSKIFHQKNPKTIKVAMTKDPKGQLYKNGPQGLLDVAINEATAQKFEKQLKEYDSSRFDREANLFVKRLNQKGLKASLYQNSPIDYEHLVRFKRPKGKVKSPYAGKDFKTMALKIGADQLLLINLNSIGAIRNYYGFIPLGAPKAICNAEGLLIDLKNNTLLWRYTATEQVKVDGSWHQPPHYPNFMRALDKAVANARNDLLNNFFQGASSEKVSYSKVKKSKTRA